MGIYDKDMVNILSDIGSFLHTQDLKYEQAKLHTYRCYQCGKVVEDGIIRNNSIFCNLHCAIISTMEHSDGDAI